MCWRVCCFLFSWQSRRAATRVCLRTPRTRRTTARTRKRDIYRIRTCAATRTTSRAPSGSDAGLGPPLKPSSWRPWRRRSRPRRSPPGTSGSSCHGRPASAWESSRWGSHGECGLFTPSTPTSRIWEQGGAAQKNDIPKKKKRGGGATCGWGHFPDTPWVFYRMLSLMFYHLFFCSAKDFQTTCSHNLYSHRAPKTFKSRSHLAL